jgi:hypothetical protein
MILKKDLKNENLEFVTHGDTSFDEWGQSYNISISKSGIKVFPKNQPDRLVF